MSPRKAVAFHEGRGSQEGIFAERGLEDLEDYYLATDVLERLRKGQEKTHSAADVRSALGLDDRIYRHCQDPTPQA